jgi:hypothetical protein
MGSERLFRSAISVSIEKGHSKVIDLLSACYVSLKLGSNAEQ